MFTQGSPAQVQTPNTPQPDRRQQDHPAVCVMAQQHSSETFVSLRFHSLKERFGAFHRCNFSFFAFWKFSSVSNRTIWTCVSQTVSVWFCQQTHSVLPTNTCVRKLFWTKRETNSLWFMPNTTMYIWIQSGNMFRSTDQHQTISTKIQNKVQYSASNTFVIWDPITINKGCIKLYKIIL
jgi:hypothetical protein